MNVVRGIGLVVSVALALACGPSVVVVADTDATAGSTDSVAMTGAPMGTSVGPMATSGPSPSTSPPDDDAFDDVLDESGVGPDPDGEEDGHDFISSGGDGGPGQFECDLFAQDCPRGEKCMPWNENGEPAWNATRCVPIAANPNQTGDACTVEGGATSGIDDCDLGLMCWNVDENGVGVCEDMCTGTPADPMCADPGDTCAQANGGAIALCVPTCDPLVCDCLGGQVCAPINDAWACVPDAASPGSYGDPCNYLTECDCGLWCVAAEALSSCTAPSGCCTPICDPNDPLSDVQCAATDPAHACVPHIDPYGVCAIPS